MTQTPNTLTAAPLTQTPQPDIRSSRILVLAPASESLTQLIEQLAADDVDAISAPKPAVAQTRLYGTSPAAVLLSAELEDGTGYQALHELRTSNAIDPACVAIAFSDRAEPLDRLRALQRGCVDFLATPIFYPELVARLGLALTRGIPTRSMLHAPGGLQIDQGARTVTVHGQPVPLSGFEYKLLAALATDPTRVWTKHELLASVWNHGHRVASRTVDSHACRLRVKLRDAGGDFVDNIWGVGYRLLDPAKM